MTDSKQAAARPVLSIGPEERELGRLSEESLQTGLSIMSQHGFLRIDNVLVPEVVGVLHTAFIDRYGRMDQRALDEEGLGVGDRRYMITVDVSGPFNDTSVYANAFYFPIINRLLGGRCVIDSFGAVCALPGAPAQHVHTDHPTLFPEHALDGLLPCHAVTLVLPLVELSTDIGPTAVWLGSHRERWLQEGKEPDRTAAFVPESALGSVYLMDYRLVHHGMANETTRPRPILYVAYARPWFTDARNFSGQSKLRMSPADRDAVPPEFRSVFARAG